MESNLEGVAAVLMENVESKDRTYHLQSFKKCFVGSDAVDYMVKARLVETREDAVELGKQILEEGLISHVTNDHDFEDAKLFYRFKALDRHRGHNEEGASWAAMEVKGKEYDDEGNDGDADEEVIEPLDEWNVKLLDLVKPPKWVNPKPHKKYNMVVIGAGTGGLISAVSTAGVGGRVALIEKHTMGGDCLNVGCVPSKALIRCARAIAEVKSAAEFGVKVEGYKVDFGKIMERMRKLRATIAPNDSFERYAGLGVDMFQGIGKFVSKDTIEVGGQTLKFARAIIATGGRARVPPIPGIETVKVLTNATIFNLTELPEVFGVIGGGPIGSEMAQSFARFGSKVYLFDRMSKILPREDPEAAEMVQSRMADDGVRFKFNATIKRLAPADGDKIEITFTMNEGPEEKIILNQLLVSAGRIPNVEGLNLEAAGVEYSNRGIKVNDRLQTSNKVIFAVGDCALPYQFT